MWQQLQIEFEISTLVMPLKHMNFWLTTTICVFAWKIVFGKTFCYFASNEDENQRNQLTLQWTFVASQKHNVDAQVFIC